MGVPGGCAVSRFDDSVCEPYGFSECRYQNGKHPLFVTHGESHVIPYAPLPEIVKRGSIEVHILSTDTLLYRILLNTGASIPLAARPRESLPSVTDLPRVERSRNRTVPTVHTRSVKPYDRRYPREVIIDQGLVSR